MKKIFVIAFIISLFASCTKEDVRVLATKSIYVENFSVIVINADMKSATITIGGATYNTQSANVVSLLKLRITEGVGFMLDVWKDEIQDARKF
jgi:hypothetical protein